MPSPKQMAWTAAIALATVLAFNQYSARKAAGGATPTASRRWGA